MTIVAILALVWRNVRARWREARTRDRLLVDQLRAVIKETQR